MLTLSRFEGARRLRPGRRRAGRRGRAARGAGARQRAAVQRRAAHRGPARGRAGQHRRGRDRAARRRRARVRQSHGGADDLERGRRRGPPDARRGAAQRVPAARRGGAPDRRRRPAERPRAARRGLRADARARQCAAPTASRTGGCIKSPRRRRRPRRGRARRERHRGRHRAAPRRAPAAVPRRGQPPALVLARPRGRLRADAPSRRCPSWPTGAASTCSTTAGTVRRATLVAAADDRPALDALRAALPLDPDDPRSIAHLLRTGASRCWRPTSTRRPREAWTRRASRGAPGLRGHPHALGPRGPDDRRRSASSA